MNDMTTRFELFVADVARAVDFYRDALGFDVATGSHDDDASYVEVRNGAAVIGIQRADSIAGTPPPGDLARLRTPPTGVELVLEVDDVDAYHDRVRQLGHPVAAPLAQRPWGERDFRLHDPDGHYLRITSRRTPRYARPARP